MNFVLIKPNQELPFDNETFDVITMLQVLEHVGNEAFAINEVKRLLKRNGVFICSTPHQGIFAWADSANFQFKFPLLYKFIYSWLNGAEWYQAQTTVINGLIGSLTESANLQHRHYTENDIRRFLGEDFFITEVYYYDCFYPLLAIMNNMINRIRGRS